MKKLLFPFILALIMLAGCHNRQDLLLPPDLAAADYLTGNTIEFYSDYLIKSSNDDSYLLITKESISDSLLNYGDEISFRVAEDFASRDSLALQQGTAYLSDTYQFSVKRAGLSLDLYSNASLAKIYTDMKPSAGSSYLLGYEYYLSATAIEPTYYGKGRAQFPLYSTGEFAVCSFADNANPLLQHTANTAFHALLVDNSGQQMAINFPADYALAAGTISLEMKQTLEQSQLASLQNFFPNAAINTPILKLQTANTVGSEIAYLRAKNSNKGYFGQQWTHLAGNLAHSWPNGNPDTQGTNWWQDSTGLYSFVSSSGSYFLLTPLEGQSEFTIPLDGSYNQLFLQELWFDLQNLNLPNTTMKVKPNPAISPLQTSYFGGSPFTMGSQYNLFEISFWEEGTLLKTLPDNNWIEFGFRTTITTSNNDRLFSVYSSTTEDAISYKTFADSYDASHYSRIGNYVYCGIANSASYLYSSFSENPVQSIPYLKSNLTMQTSRAAISWSDSKKRSFSRLQLQYNTSLPVHPWLQGEPFTLSNPDALASFSFYQGDAAVTTLPSNFLLSLPVESSFPNVLLFGSNSYPRLKNYLSSTVLSSDSFVLADGYLDIYPEFSGQLIGAGISWTNPFPLVVYPTMTFAFEDIRFYTYGSAPEGSSAVFDLTKSSNLSDPYNLLSTQYNLSQTSEAWTVTTAEESNFSLYEPVLFFKRSSRNNELLVYENAPPNYRLYTYSQSTEFNPWYFVVDGGYNGISLAYNGSYASFTDINPHNYVTSLMNTSGENTIASLYLAQFVMPAFFAGNPFPAGGSVKLEKLSTFPTPSPLLAAYQLLFKDAAGAVYFPGFYNIAGALQEPYLYVPVQDIDAIPAARFFYRNMLGATTELERVNSFSDTNYANEYVVLGNSFICTVPNPGWFYVTGP